jgi:hypothetical protein
MAKGFAPVLEPEKKVQQPTPGQLTPINEIQASLLNYVQAIPDPQSFSNSKTFADRYFSDCYFSSNRLGAQGWEDLENYGLSKQAWLSEFLELPNGIPSDDTFRRVFERINPEALEQVLSQWLQHFMGSLAGEVVPIDGKNLKGSYDRNQGIKALHLVTA